MSQHPLHAAPQACAPSGTTRTGAGRVVRARRTAVSAHRLAERPTAGAVQARGRRRDVVLTDSRGPHRLTATCRHRRRGACSRAQAPLRSLLRGREAAGKRPDSPGSPTSRAHRTLLAIHARAVALDVGTSVRASNTRPQTARRSPAHMPVDGSPSRSRPPRPAATPGDSEARFPEVGRESVVRDCRLSCHGSRARRASARVAVRNRLVAAATGRWPSAVASTRTQARSEAASVRHTRRVDPGSSRCNVVLHESMSRSEGQVLLAVGHVVVQAPERVRFRGAWVDDDEAGPVGKRREAEYCP